MAAEYNCTQYFSQYPEANSDEAKDLFITSLIDTIVKPYRPYHYYILTSLVLFAFFANIMIVIVISQKEMRSSGVNVTMMLIAVCDFGCSVSALAQLLLRNFSDYYSSYITAYAQLIVDYFQIAFHASSLYLAVGMSFCRAISLVLTKDTRDTWQSPRYALRLGIVLCLPVFFIASTNLFLNYVKEKDENGLVELEVSPLSVANSCWYMKFALVLSGSLFKIIPCILMSGLSIVILGKINAGKQRAIALSRSQSDNTQSKIDRSSRFIQCIIIIFVVTEFPQGFFSVVGGLSINDYINYFQFFSVFTNLLAYFNTTTSFIIYSTLSSKFRKLFVQLFVPRFIKDRIGKSSNIVVVQSTFVESHVI
ncbi:G-protein coupled receptors family 1 profile domain-containing protein [Caenorhabditis elegans]|uniref:G-protein coupled receptors family 1 profile domain-containing protein n=1 Tax=Caenorhabditis elegans TaxID=6239 RepID=Q95PY1_CAEEL|nr:G-protein coupled receptors family 1 profile domain-containing protein [Caenorhabditis elegans]CCD72499.1 G-protein coupled receptors family 1 profile domain-containing protein [Caenorhabditis elegans]|eukprot:NP_504723.1 DroMyoSuppressin Receptor related [Caenorhabditis elegans]